MIATLPTTSSAIDVESILRDALAQRASDVHVEPQRDDALIKFRIDGLLRSHATVSREQGRMIVNRLMVLANLLTYKQDVPQEGRAVLQGVEVRIAIMPTTQGLRAAARLPAELLQPRTLTELSLGAQTMQMIDRFIRSDSGMLLVCGPAGSGKTTTCYAILTAIAQLQQGLSIISLEDPVERDLPGVTQIQVQPFGQLSYASALRSILRQDPQVLMLGEIRDADTASVAVQASLSGHRLISTLHASDPAGAIARLLEMNIEPYQISSSLFGVLTQRLLRKLAPAGSADRYAGRAAVSMSVAMNDDLRQRILARADAGTIRQLPGLDAAAVFSRQTESMIASCITDADEAARVFPSQAHGASN